MNDDTNMLQLVAQRITDRTEELMLRRALGSFDDDDVSARLDELAPIMEYVVELMRADVARLTAHLQ